MDARVREGRSTLYCASFQLAWDALRGVVGGDVLLEERLDLAEGLNRLELLGPFLLLLRERGAAEPYLALRVGDPDSLVRAGR